MKKKIFISVLILTTTVFCSFSQLPPVFGSEYEGITQKDELTRVFISPVRVMWTSDKTGEFVKNTDVLLKPGNSQSDMSRITQFCSIKSTETDTSSILLDYGKELHGGLQLVMGGSSRREPSLVRIRFGESVGEANSTTYNSDWLMGFSTDDHAKRDIVMEIPRSGLIEIGNTGFRFVRIDLIQPNTTINLKEARAILRYRDVPYLGSFKSSNPRLDSIWITGAYTTHLNMQEFLWDGIKRDRLVWLCLAGRFSPGIKNHYQSFRIQRSGSQQPGFGLRTISSPSVDERNEFLFNVVFNHSPRLVYAKRRH